MSSALKAAGVGAATAVGGVPAGGSQGAKATPPPPAAHHIMGATTNTHNAHPPIMQQAHTGMASSGPAHLPGGFSPQAGKAPNHTSPSNNHQAPLSLVQEKPAASQPLALTRPDKKDQPEPHSNGVSDSPEKPSTPDKSEESNAKIPEVPTTSSLPDDAAATSPDKTALPAEPASLPSETEKPAENQLKDEPAPSVGEKPPDAIDKPAATLPSKPVDNKIEQNANADPVKPEVPEQTVSKADYKDSAIPVEKPLNNGDEIGEHAAVSKSEPKELPVVKETPALPVEAANQAPPAETAPVPATPTSPAKPNSPRLAAQKKPEAKPKSTMKLATVTPTLSRKRKAELKTPLKLIGDGPSPAKKSPREKPAATVAAVDGTKDDAFPAEDVATPDGRISKRNRTKVQPYQSPTPELVIMTKLSATQGRTTPVSKVNQDKLIVFYKNEFLAVRNAEGGFYVCQSMQNVYRNSRKIKIRWLSQDKSADPNGEIYKPDFYDVTDMECVLTTLSLQRQGGLGLKLGAQELARTQSILGRALAVERGEPAPETSVTEEHPDGLDLSLYKDESQLEKKKQKASAATPSRKRTHSKSSPKTPRRASNTEGEEAEESEEEDDEEEEVVVAKASPKKKSKPSSPKKKGKTGRGRKSKGRARGGSSTQASAPAAQPPSSATPTDKTAVAPAKEVKTPAKAAPAGRKSKTPAAKNGPTPTPPAKPSKGKTKAVAGKSTPAKAAKAAALVPTPSTSTGKTTRGPRSPRKPPSSK